MSDETDDEPAADTVEELNARDSTESWVWDPVFGEVVPRKESAFPGAYSSGDYLDDVSDEQNPKE